MRALCGAVLTFAALVGLGLTAVGAGSRYQDHEYRDERGQPQWVRGRDLDTGLMAAQVTALLALVVGLATTFLGLAQHHYRRNQEMLHQYGRLPMPAVFGPPVVIRPVRPVREPPTP
jgi:hypothetical protein